MALVASLALFVAIIYLIDELNTNRILLAMVIVFLVLLVLFYSLTVEVDHEKIVAKFGPGLIYKTIVISKITSCKLVRNKWWYGWGIRLTPHGWMFNVSGLDAIEIVHQNGKTFRIGTDDGENLLKSINARIGA